MTMASDGWIMRPFNGLFFAVFGGFLLVLILGSALLRRKSEACRRGVIVTACLLTLLGFIAYKYALSLDREYDVITAGMGGFNWWGELPLHLCNINMLLIPVAVCTRKRPLLSFCFFVGPLGALMALIMPGNGFSGYSLLLPRMLGYYGTHFMIVIECLAIVTLGFYRPRFKDLPGTVAAILCISLVIFGINLLLRYTGLHPKANYFYSVETEGNFLLELFHSWLPWPYLYLLPCYLILVPYMAVITGGFALADRRKKREKK